LTKFFFFFNENSLFLTEIKQS